MSLLIHKSISLFLLCNLVMASATVADTVYRNVDEEGVVEFSDQAQPGAEEIKVQEVPVIRMQKPVTASPVSKKSKAAGSENSISILEPQMDATIRDNEGKVLVKLQVTPELKAGQTIQLFLDGKMAAQTQKTEHQFVGMDRGTHKLHAVLVDEQVKVKARSEEITFHLKRFSRLFEQRPRIKGESPVKVPPINPVAPGQK